MAGRCGAARLWSIPDRRGILAPQKETSMSKSLKRVARALEEAGIDTDIQDLGETRTAQQAADAAGCALDQIAKSIIFRGENSGEAILFLTAGGNRVDAAKASTVAGEPLGKADAALIRAQTGFAIGGVSPIGHLNPIRAYLDPRLLDFDRIWAAAGTPRHVFAMDAHILPRLTGAQTADFTE
ncbi:YbaK/EbsC family protein [Ferrimonas balearica]|nr:YbaK/EbsC family protein [Ferrimonas balearica]